MNIKKCVVVFTSGFLLTFLVITYSYKGYSKTDYVKTLSITSPANESKHILLWTSPKTEPFIFIGQEGNEGFVRRNCTFTNCFVSANRDYFSNYDMFDAVVFAMSEATHYKPNQLPQHRSPRQKYVFSSIESSHYYPACSNRFDGYFNWTWSFRLDSDCRWEYMAIRDEFNNVIGPNKIMHWMKADDMRPVSEDLKRSLKTKTKAAAWFASNCHSKSRREVFVQKLQNELAKYNHTVDVYGKCGKLKCTRGKAQCADAIRKDYYFYLSFENSFSEDYVTEKLLTALKNNAVPIVYGKANYTRFMPDGIYLDANDLGEKKLAEIMIHLINNQEEYANYFRWKNHYSYYNRSESVETDDYCAFCKLLNDKNEFNKKSVIQDFRQWWDNPNFCPRTSLSNQNKSTFASIVFSIFILSILF